MKNPKRINQIDPDSPEARKLINRFRSALSLRMEVSDNSNLELIISINRDVAYKAICNFFRDSFMKKMNLSDNELINAIPLSASESIQPNHGIKKLTPREIDILEELLSRKPLKDAAIKLGISYLTAKKQMKSIYAKLDVKKESMAIVEYLKLKGVIQLPVTEVHRL